jgi:methyltransferase (TIGR00027 family)
VPRDEASLAAQRVARHRLSATRLRGEFGDHVADERFTHDLLDPSAPEPDAAVAAYLGVRTAFFDRVVVDATERGVAQVVVVGGGLDGRPLRYGRPGVRWFELDHPEVLRDKAARLDRLGIDCAGAFPVPVDLAAPGVDDRVGRALDVVGHDAAVPTLVLCEGVATRLPRPVVAAVLTQLRGRCAPGSRLAISLSIGAAAVCNERREAVQAAAESLAGGARHPLTAADAVEVFRATGWSVVESSRDDSRRQRALHAGLLLLTPT